MAVSEHPLLHPLRAVTNGTHPVLAKYPTRPRTAPGGHGRLLRAALARAVSVPDRLAARASPGTSRPSYLIRELAHILPGQSARDLLNTVRAIQHDAGTLGVLGFIGLVWGTLGFYSALESALNIVYGVQNRTFLRQKG